MATLSDNLLMRLLVMGESAGGGYANWGEVANADLQMLEDKLTEQEIIAVSTTNVNLTDDQFRRVLLKFTGTLTGDRVIGVPARKGFWFVRDFTVRGGFDLTIKVTGNPGVKLPEKGVDIIYCDGTDCYSLLVHASSPFNRIMRTTDMPTPLAGHYTVLAKNSAGAVGFADIASSNVTNFTAFTS